MKDYYNTQKKTFKKKDQKKNIKRYFTLNKKTTTCSHDFHNNQN